MIHFTNANRGIMSAGPTKSEIELANRISEEYSEEAEKAGAVFLEELKKELEKVKDPAYSALAVQNVMRRVPRYAYLKNVGGCEVEIDLLLHAFTKFDPIA